MENNDYITLQFHNEYAQRIKDEDERQNYRIKALEKAVAENNKLAYEVLHRINIMVGVKNRKYKHFIYKVT